jgi:hypothetical protein
MPTEDSLRLRAIAEQLAQSFDRHAPPRALLLAGSAGEGIADELSDIDLIAYYDRLPTLSAIRAWRLDVGVALPGAAVDRRKGWSDTWQRTGVECQSGGQRVALIEKSLRDLLQGRAPDSPYLMKPAMGLLHGLTIRDDGLIAAWRERIREMPDALARSMASHHLKVFPYWAAHKQLAKRDARLFEVQSLLDGAFHVVGALSAANGLYFTTFQFKRMRVHIAAMEHKPPQLAERLEALFDSPREVAAAALRQLLTDTVEIVEARFGDLATAGARQSLDDVHAATDQLQASPNPRDRTT